MRTGSAGSAERSPIRPRLAGRNRIGRQTKASFQADLIPGNQGPALDGPDRNRNWRSGIAWVGSVLTNAMNPLGTSVAGPEPARYARAKLKARRSRRVAATKGPGCRRSWNNPVEQWSCRLQPTSLDATIVAIPNSRM